MARWPSEVYHCSTNRATRSDAGMRVVGDDLAELLPAQAVGREPLLDVAEVVAERPVGRHLIRAADRDSIDHIVGVNRRKARTVATVVHEVEERLPIRCPDRLGREGNGDCRSQGRGQEDRHERALESRMQRWALRMTRNETRPNLRSLARSWRWPKWSTPAPIDRLSGA